MDVDDEEEDMGKNNSSSNENEDYNSGEGSSENLDSEKVLTGEGGVDKYGDTPDFDHYCKVSYPERLYNDILSEHHGHNKGQTLK